MRSAEIGVTDGWARGEWMDRTPEPGRLASSPLLSVVVPVRDEADNVGPLVAEIRAALDGRVEYEIVYVDDASTDATPARLRALAPLTGNLRVLRHRDATGQSAAIRTGVEAARGRLIATIDGDGQNDPADLLRLRSAWLDAGGGPALLVVGERGQRRAGWLRHLSSVVANAVRRRVLGDGSRDTGCGLKMVDRETYLALPAFDHMHRFLPALVLRAGGRVITVPVQDRPRHHGRSHYGVGNRLGAGLIDLLGVLWLQRRPLHPVVEDGLVAGPRPASPAPGSRPRSADWAAPAASRPDAARPGTE